MMRLRLLSVLWHRGWSCIWWNVECAQNEVEAVTNNGQRRRNNVINEAYNRKRKSQIIFRPIPRVKSVYNVRDHVTYYGGWYNFFSLQGRVGGLGPLKKPTIVGLLNCCHTRNAAFNAHPFLQRHFSSLKFSQCPKISRKLSETQYGANAPHKSSPFSFNDV